MATHCASGTQLVVIVARTTTRSRLHPTRRHSRGAYEHSIEPFARSFAHSKNKYPNALAIGI